MKYQLVIFDLDGVLIDSERLSQQHWKEVCPSYGYEIDDAFFHRIMGGTQTANRAICKEVFGESFPYDDIRHSGKHKIMNAFLQDEKPLKKGAREILAYLKEHHYQIALATSSDEEYASTILKRCGLLEYFDTLVCGNQVKNSKPAPDIFLEAARRAQVDVSECVVIEDSQNGILAASNANMYAVFVEDLIPNNEVINQHMSIQLKDLLEVIKHLGGKEHV